MEKPKKKLLVLAREAIRRKHYSKRTEKAYIYWIKRYLFFHNKQHPLDMGNREIELFLTHLAINKRVSASTQNQAFSALLFLYREVLDKPLEGPINSLRAKRPKRLPTVLTREETFRVIQCTSGTHQLMAKLLYGSGLRLSECVELRVKDIDFAQRQIIVRDAKGMQDRVTILPEGLVKPLREQFERVSKLHQEDLRKGGGSVYLPFALERKYRRAGREWGWQYVFPSARLARDPSDGVLRRWYMSETTLQRAVHRAAGYRASISLSVAIHSAIVLRRTCFKTVMTFERYMSCWDTRTSRQQ